VNTAAIAAGITLGIAIAGFIIGIIKTTSGISTEFGKMQQRLDNNEKQDEREREHTSTKFSELYNRTAGHDAALASLTAGMSSMSTTMQKMDSKLDRLIEKSYGKGDTE